MTRALAEFIKAVNCCYRAEVWIMFRERESERERERERERWKY